MVRTGARAARLLDGLEETGLGAARQPAPARPSIDELPASTATELLTVYDQLGGVETAPAFRPGAWDLRFAGDLLVELDEELHFNRYRAITLMALRPPCPATTAVGRRATRACATRLILPPWKRSSPSCAAPATRNTV